MKDTYRTAKKKERVGQKLKYFFGWPQRCGSEICMEGNPRKETVTKSYYFRSQKLSELFVPVSWTGS